MVHDGVKIVIRVAELEREKQEEEEKENEASEMEVDDVIEIWESCAVCDAKTSRMKMDDGA